jgi:hypothetical protein
MHLVGDGAAIIATTTSRAWMLPLVHLRETLCPRGQPSRLAGLDEIKKKRLNHTAFQLCDFWSHRNMSYY